MVRAVSCLGFALVFGAFGVLGGPGGIGAVSCGLSSVGAGADADGWRLQRSSTGGFTGKGGPNLVVTSDGELLVMPGGLGNAPKQGADPAAPLCRYALTPEQLRIVAQAAVSARPVSWGNAKYTAPGNPSGCCDQFLHTLSLERHRDSGSGVERGQASWYDDAVDRLPPDVAALSAALDKVQQNDGHCPSNALPDR